MRASAVLLALVASGCAGSGGHRYCSTIDGEIRCVRELRYPITDQQFVVDVSGETCTHGGLSGPCSDLPTRLRSEAGSTNPQVFLCLDKSDSAEVVMKLLSDLTKAYFFCQMPSNCDAPLQPGTRVTQCVQQ
jgi:hypothetical protein